MPKLRSYCIESYQEAKRYLAYVDQGLLLIIMALVSIGFIIMSSASMDFAMKERGDVFYFSVHQLLYIVLALAVGFMTFFISTSLLQRLGPSCFFAAFILLLAVLLIGNEVNGSKRWISLGVVNLQASEFAKIMMFIYMAGYLVRRRDEVRETWRGFFKPIGVFMLVAMLLMLEPDFGATVVLLFGCVCMMFLAGLGIKQVIILGGCSLGAAVLAAMGSAYRMERLHCFMDPWTYAYGCGYQLTQSLIAFGRGGFEGLGLGQSVQKLFYLPEAHTDFVFAILAEELGFIGATLVVLLFAALIYKMFKVALKAQAHDKLFAAYLVYGLSLSLALQIFINIGVNTGLLPTKGLTLPLLSYGGSSLLAVAITLGIVLRIDAQMRFEEMQASSENLRSRRLAA